MSEAGKRLLLWIEEATLGRVDMTVPTRLVAELEAARSPSDERLTEALEATAFTVRKSRPDASEDYVDGWNDRGKAIRAAALGPDPAYVEPDERLREALVRVKRFSEAHHSDQGSYLWLHALLVDIPSMVDTALAAHVEPDRCAFGACDRPRESHRPYATHGEQPYITGHDFVDPAHVEPGGEP